MKLAKVLFLIIVYPLALNYLSCGYYSFSGASVPSHLKTVALPLFENRTTEFGIPEDLNVALINEFTRDNTLKVTNSRTADSIIEGVVLNIREQPGAYNVEEQVKEIRIYVRIKAKFEDLKKNKIMWEEQIEQWGIYRPDSQTGDNSTRQDAITEALEKIVSDIFVKTIAGW